MARLREVIIRGARGGALESSEGWRKNYLREKVSIRGAAAEARQATSSCLALLLRPAACLAACLAASTAVCTAARDL